MPMRYPGVLLVNNESVYIFKDSIIDLQKIDPVYFKEKTVVVKGLKNGTSLVSRTVPGAYPGMKAQLYSKKPQL